MVKSTNAFAAGIAALALGLSSGALLLGCQSDDAATEKAPAEKAEPAKEAPKASAAPAGTKLSKVANDMSPQQVQEIMGAPDGQGQYPTGKSFAPFQYSNDSGWRSEYKYKGQGRVVFANPRYGGSQKVVQVIYDPAEDGN